MSTNKTENYGLHAWVPEDDFLLQEINENFAALDGRAVRIAFGTYAGDGVNGREITLGFTPLALLVSCGKGVFDTNYYYYGGLTIQGHPSIMTESRRVLEIVEGGFMVYYDDKGSPAPTSNRSGDSYYYLAFH